MITQDNRNFRNRILFHGDTIDFMRAMNSQSAELRARRKAHEVREALG